MDGSSFTDIRAFLALTSSSMSVSTSLINLLRSLWINIPSSTDNFENVSMSLINSCIRSLAFCIRVMFAFPSWSNTSLYFKNNRSLKVLIFLSGSCKSCEAMKAKRSRSLFAASSRLIFSSNCLLSSLACSSEALRSFISFSRFLLIATSFCSCAISR